MKLLEDDLYQERMQERVAEIEGIIKEFLPIELTEQKTVFAAMEYSLMAGGFFSDFPMPKTAVSYA